MYSEFFQEDFSRLANNICVTLSFNRNISRDMFPSSIFVVLHTMIEEDFLGNNPTTFDDDENVRSMRSKVLQLKLDPTKSKFSNENPPVVTYSILGVNDFGSIVQLIEIYQNLSYLENLISIELKDDVRTWNEQYQRSTMNNSFQHRFDPTRICRFLSMDDCPSESADGFNG